MAKIPEPQNSIAARIDKYHEEIAECAPPRAHLGCSQLGHPCDRWLWLSFRWAVRQRFSGRMLRVFRRGSREEQVVVEDLRAIGVDVRRAGADQARVTLAPHVSGSVDGIIEGGVPHAPMARHVLEIKTHAKKSFDALEKHGVEKAQPEHYVQMQLYMHGLGIDRALYVAVCKDDDRIYTERVRYDKEVAEKYVERARRIVFSDRMPEPISADPDFYLCKTCPAWSFCHKTHLTDQVNCRTCAHSTPKPDGTWRCERFGSNVIPLQYQRKGCEHHVLHPDLVPWQLRDGPDRWTACYEIAGARVLNGRADGKGTFSSRELIEMFKDSVRANEEADEASEAGHQPINNP